MQQPVQSLCTLVTVEKEARCPFQRTIPLAVELELLRSGTDVGGGVLRLQLGARPVDVVLIAALITRESVDGFEPV